MDKIVMVDSPCGSGKTEWAIAYMNEHSQDQFIFVTPFLDEVRRIKNGTTATFYDPQNFQRTDLLGGDLGHKSKLEDFNDLLTNGQNVVTTHVTFCNASQETLRILQDSNYHLIIDESVDVLLPLNDVVDTADNRVNRKDAELLSNNGLIQVDEDCHVRWTGGNLPIDGAERHKYAEVQRHADNGTLLLIDNRFFIWEFPPEVLEAMESITILSYLIEGSYMGAYLKLHAMEYTKVSVTGSYGQGFELIPYSVGMEQRNLWRKLITIYQDDPQINYGPLSVTWYRSNVEKHPKSPEAVKLRKGLRRFFEAKMKAAPNDVMWSCPKSSRNAIAPKGYKVTRKLSDAEQKRTPSQLDEYIDDNGLRCWVASNARATKSYSDRHILAFMLDVNPNPEITKYFGRRGASLSRDAFALAGLVQWVWRSAIRNGEPITLYLPSSRMRRLFSEWLEGKR